MHLVLQNWQLDTKLFGTPAVNVDGLPYNVVCGEDSAGYHRLVWTVIDECGEVDSCSLMVRMEDCVPPVVDPPQPVTIIFPVDQDIVISAQQLVTGALDDCSPFNFMRYSFSEDFFDPVTRLNCDSIESNGSNLFEFNVWIGDGGQDRNCDGSITWDERAKTMITNFVFADDDCQGLLFDGKILTENQFPVANAQIIFSGEGPLIMTETDSAGGYRVPDEVDRELDYMIVPIKTGDEPEGLSTLDLIKIQKHLLGTEIFDSPFKIIAADANNNRDVSALDLVEIRKVILRLNSEFPNNTSWRFVPQSYVFPDSTAPWLFPEFSTLDELNFIGMKVGDVNGTVAQAHGSPYQFRVTTEIEQDGGLQYVHVYASDAMYLSGLQFTLELGESEFQEIKGGLLDITTDEIAVHKHCVTASWIHLPAMRVIQGEKLFTLVLKGGSGTVRFSDRVTRTEAYIVADGEDVPAVLNVQLHESYLEALTITALPNPFSTSTDLQVYSGTANEATLQLTSVDGRLVTSRQVLLTAGLNSITVRQDDLKGPGLYFCTVSSPTGFVTQKILLAGNR